jgi:hypothetical protein
MRRAITAVIGLCLLAGPLQASALFGGPPEPDRKPTRFVKFDGYDLGLYGGDPFMAAIVRVAKITCTLNRFRFGIAAADGYSSLDYWDAGMLLPVRAGFTLWSNPKATGPVWGAVPDLYVETSASMWGIAATSLLLDFRMIPSDYNGLRARAALCCDVDYYGLGARLEFGALSVQTTFWPEWRVNALYASFQLRGLALGIGF